MLIGNQIIQVRSTCHCLRKSNNSSVFSGKNAGKFHMGTMDDVRGDFLGPQHATTQVAVIANKKNNC